MEWDIYVLKYKRTGNYYVGTAPNWKSRIKVHHTKTAPKKLNSNPSKFNKANEGFYYFVYEINGVKIDKQKLGENQNISDIEQSISCIVENALTKFLKDWAREGIIVNGGCFSINSKEKNEIFRIVKKNKMFKLSENEQLLFEKELPNIFKYKLDNITDTNTIKVIDIPEKEVFELKLLNFGEL